MAAPTYTARVTPSSYPMKDGYRSLVTLAVSPSLMLWEKNVQLSGADGGDPIPYSNMHTGTWHTERPRSLKRRTPITMRCAYTGLSMPALEALVNVETTISQLFPSGHWVAFYGYLRSAIPQDHQEGNPPECQVIIQPTMWDPSGNVEAAPVYGTAS